MPIQFLKTCIEFLLVCKSALFHDFGDWRIGMEQVLIGMVKSDTGQVLLECDAHTLAEETAEVFPADAEFVCHIGQGDCIAVMFFHPGENLVDAVAGRLPGFRCIVVSPYAKMAKKSCKYL